MYVRFLLLLKVNRQNQDNKKAWKPGSNARICSRHFIGGQPTAAHPDPCLFLGILLFIKTI
jgi:hypothetical protein